METLGPQITKARKTESRPFCTHPAAADFYASAVATELAGWATDLNLYSHFFSNLAHDLENRQYGSLCFYSW